MGHSAAAHVNAAAVSMSASTDHFHASGRSVAQGRAQCRLRSHRCGDGRSRRAIAAPRRKTSRWTSPEAGSRCRRVAAVDGNTLHKGNNVLFKNVDSVPRRTQRSLPVTASPALPVRATWARLLPSCPWLRPPAAPGPHGLCGPWCCWPPPCCSSCRSWPRRPSRRLGRRTTCAPPCWTSAWA